MRIDKKIRSVQYDVKLTFTDEEKKTLKNALNILKIIDKTLEDDQDACFSSVEKDVIAIIYEIDKYTDYICK